MRITDRHGLRILTHAAGLAPLALLAWRYWQGQFLADPVREITTITGRTALILLWLSLAITPAVTLTRIHALARLRRPLGLYAFLYAGVHFLTFVGLDYRLDWPAIREAIFYQRYVIVGFAAGVILLLLALTSTRGWQRRLGANWRRLHYLAYVAGILAVVHFLWLVKDTRVPVRYAGVLAVLLVMRIPPVKRLLARIWERGAPDSPGKPHGGENENGESML
jgi:methionine sulfoxide reductase heme-binding subunit